VKRLSMILFLGAAVLGQVPVASATEVGRGRDFGLGVAIGSPTSIVGKYYLSQENAIDFGLGFWTYGWGCGRHGYCDGRSFDVITVNADYLWQDEVARGAKVNLDWHIGAGGRFWAGGGTALAARMPVGLDLMFRKPAWLELFVEIAPALYIVPGVGLDLEGFLGVRFYF